MEFNPPDENNPIILTDYSIVDMGFVCAQVLTLFMEKVEDDLLPSGT